MTPTADPAAGDDNESRLAAERSGSASADMSPVDVPVTGPPTAARNLPLLVLAALACVVFLSWAQSFLVPLILGIVISYALTPLVGWLETARIPRSIGTVTVMAGVIGALCLGAYSLRGQVQTIIDQVPEAATQFADGISRVQLSRAGNLKTIQDAAAKVEKATSQAAGALPASAQATTHVIVDEPRFKLGDFLWESSMGAVGAMGQAATVVFLVFFLLLGGRHVQAEAGPDRGSNPDPPEDCRSHTRRHQRLDPEVHAHAARDQRAGSCGSITFHWIGLDNAGAWAVVSGLLHTVPYLGPGLTAIATGLPPSCSSTR